MIGLDTNVLVRHLVQDDPGQSRKALVWVLESVLWIFEGHDSACIGKTVADEPAED